MEMLRRSSYPNPFKIQVKPSPFSLLLGRFHSLKPNLSSPTRSELTRVDLISSKHENPSPFSSPSSENVSNMQVLSSSGADSAKGYVPQSHSHDSGKKIEVIRTWGTRVVGLTLLVIGAMGIREASECHASRAHLAPEKQRPKQKIGLTTFATGIVHGLQPDALMMVLPALALPSRVAGAAFLGMFLVGTVIAMGSYTVFIGSFSELLKDRVPRITEMLTWFSSLIAIGLGLAIIISQYFGYSLY